LSAWEAPLSGTLARAGAGLNEGIQVAADVFNRKNGKHKIKLITIDDESSPAKAVAAVEKLASQNVVAITGGYVQQHRSGIRRRQQSRAGLHHVGRPR